jgi:hypothetical protein
MRLMIQTEAEKRAQERQKRLRKYFVEPPDPRDRTVARVILVVGAGAFFVALTVALYFNVFLGAVVMFGAVLSVAAGLERLLSYRRRYAKTHPRPDDREMDHHLAVELVNVRSVALEKLGVTCEDLELTEEGWDPVAELERGGPVLTSAERHPLVVFGPDDDARGELGRDLRWRFSAYRVMAICPTQFNLGLHLCTVDLLTGAHRREETHEYQYDDVSAVRTVTVGEPRSAIEVCLRGEDVRFARVVLRELQIVTSGGDGPRIEVAVPVEDGAPVQSSGVDQVIASVRRVLRDRKAVGQAHSV